jgi:hypothetical protein
MLMSVSTRVAEVAHTGSTGVLLVRKVFRALTADLISLRDELLHIRRRLEVLFYFPLLEDMSMVLIRFKALSTEGEVLTLSTVEVVLSRLNGLETAITCPPDVLVLSSFSWLLGISFLDFIWNQHILYTRVLIRNDIIWLVIVLIIKCFGHILIILLRIKL